MISEEGASGQGDTGGRKHSDTTGKHPRLKRLGRGGRLSVGGRRSLPGIKLAEEHVLYERPGSPPAGSLASYVSALVDVAVEEGVKVAALLLRRQSRDQLQGFVSGLVLQAFDSSQTQLVGPGGEEEPPVSSELYCYADNFVQGVLRDATGLYREQQREEQQRLDAMWQRATERFALDAQYFNAEFSGATRRPSRCRYTMRARFAPRRHSMDESRVSLGRHRMWLQPALAAPRPWLRRCSEPAARHALRFLLPPEIHPPPADCEEEFDQLRRADSSDGSSSSREMLLDWLEQRQRAHPSTERPRTISSHIEWFVQDLTLDAFNDAFHELFGQHFHRPRDDLSSLSPRSGASYHSPSSSLGEHMDYLAAPRPWGYPQRSKLSAVIEKSQGR